MGRARRIGPVSTAGGLLLLVGCTTHAIPEGRNRLDTGLVQEFRLPVSSMLGRKFETVVRQQYDFSCGSAALATLLSFHYNDPQSEQRVFLGMFRNGDRQQIRRLGFSLLDMKRYLADRGVSADGYRVSLDQIAQAQTPGIVLLDYNGYKHFVVVKGIVGDRLLLGDPSLGLRLENRKVFTRQWNGVFFAINGRAGVARSHFNQPADLARAPGFRMHPSAPPLSLAGLALTRPILGEF